MKAMQAERYAEPQFPWLNLGHIHVSKYEWGKALSCYEEVYRLQPEFPIPEVPSMRAAIFLPPEEGRKAGTIDEQQAVKDVITIYWQAWNEYNADSLRQFSNPLSTETSKNLLLHLAAAKIAGSTFSVVDTRVLHIGDGVAIMETNISVLGKTEAILHLLQQTNGIWEVVIRLSIDEFPSSL